MNDIDLSIAWWGYLHINGSIQVKRFFDHQDLVEAASSDFVDEVEGPFKAVGREEAICVMKERLGRETDNLSQLRGFCIKCKNP